MKKLTGNKLAKQRESLAVTEMGDTPLGRVLKIGNKYYLEDFCKKTPEGIPYGDNGNMRFIEITPEDLKFMKNEIDEIVDKLESKVNLKKLLFQLIKDYPIEVLRKIHKQLDDPTKEIEEINGCYELRFADGSSIAWGGHDAFKIIENEK